MCPADHAPEPGGEWPSGGKDQSWRGRTFFGGEKADCFSLERNLRQGWLCSILHVWEGD
ncbi:MAG: hypothetical protein ACK56I_19265 [bacterium]